MMDTGPLTKIFLTEEQARQFLQFQKRLDFINMLESIKAFDIRNGSIKIHFDGQGEIKIVDKNECYRLP